MIPFGQFQSQSYRAQLESIRELWERISIDCKAAPRYTSYTSQGTATADGMVKNVAV